MTPIPFVFLFLISTAIAADPCDPDANRFCQNLKNEADRINCLVSHREEVSTECKEELKRLNQLVKDSGVRSGGISSFVGVMGGVGLVPPKKKILSLEGMTAYEGNPLVINQGKVSLISPMWKKEKQSFTTSLTAGTVKFNERILLPDGQKLGELHRLEVGGQYTKFSENKFFGVRSSLGSAGDKPFHSGRELAFSLNGFYAPRADQDSLWVWTVFLSNNNPLLNYFPIPGFIYFYRKDNFTGMFGLPFMSIQWTPVKKWLLSASFFITNFKTQLTYTTEKQTQWGLGFSVNQQTFLRKKREELTDRLFLNEKRLYLSMRKPFVENILGEIQGGLSFDRSLKEGKRFNDTDWERDLGRSAFLSASLNTSF